MAGAAFGEERGFAEQREHSCLCLPWSKHSRSTAAGYVPASQSLLSWRSQCQSCPVRTDTACMGLAELPRAWEAGELALVRLTFARAKRSTETAPDLISIQHAVLSYMLFFFRLPSSSHCPNPQPLSFFFTGIFRGVGCRRRVTITSGRAISWTSCAFTSLKSGVTGHTPCSAVFIQPSPWPVATTASKAWPAASS